MPKGRPHHVVFVAYDGVELLDVAGPASVFSTATALLGRRAPGYRITIAGPRRPHTRTFGGVRLGVDAILTELRGPIGSLIVPGGVELGAQPIAPRMIAAVREVARRSSRVAGVCSGAFVLAAAGLLDGKRATTHWAGGRLLRARYPKCHVEDDAIFVRDGSVWTSAGVTAGIDLALALVEQDHGRELALGVARWLVVYLHRQGGQSQYSAPLAAQVTASEPLRDLLAWMGEHRASDLRVPALARRVGMSERNFARVFRREVGIAPAAHVESLRVEAARRELETTTSPIKRIAVVTGFGTAETLHRVFQRVLHVTPTEYRERFRVGGPRARSSLS